MNTYRYLTQTIDSVELKCLVVSKGVKVDNAVYRAYAKTSRLNVSPLMCNCMLLSDGTVVQLTDMGFHLQYLSGALSWKNLKLLRYAAALKTPFSVVMLDGKAALYYEKQFLDFVTFPEPTDFYLRKTTSGKPFIGNAVLQGLNWVAFQCLWPCEYAAAGKPCQFCFSGDDFCTRAQKSRPQPDAVAADDVAEIVEAAFTCAHSNSIQITGGSTFDGSVESQYIKSYLSAIQNKNSRKGVAGELLLYITPPADHAHIDDYLRLGANRIGCSLEVWDEALAAKVTPGKIHFTTRARHLSALTYTAERYGASVAFSNLIIGLESIESLMAGAKYLAERKILPTASVWMPMGRPVEGSMTPPDVDYFRRVKEGFAELYTKYGLVPPDSRGLNVCIERDIYKFAQNKKTDTADVAVAAAE